MSNKVPIPPLKHPETPQSICGGLTEERISQVRDQGVRELATACVAMSSGIAAVLLQPRDASLRMLGEQLGEVNITLDDARQLAADGEALLSIHEERIAKDSAARAATNKVDLARTRTHQQLQGFANIIRGQLGPRSTALELFGVKKVGGAGRRKPASQKGSQDNASEKKS